ncbi:MAG: autotransporter domain-containing protein [Rhodobacter sp.]|nr:autotransporter domain-containing protein [Rhodobacter sp.]
MTIFAGGESSAPAVYGGEAGIAAQNHGTGQLMIAAGNARGGVTGVEAYNGPASVAPEGLSITVFGHAEGGGHGIFARNAGAGPLRVNTVDVSGGVGIYGQNFGAGAGLSIIASGTVTGASQGVWARNDGLGETMVWAKNVIAHGPEGAVSVQPIGSVPHLDPAAPVAGILALGGASAGGMQITTAGAVVSAGTGIHATNFGGGALQISSKDVSAGLPAGSRARGDLADGTAAQDPSSGIVAFQSEAGTGGLTITTTGGVFAEGAGIYARNEGAGALTIVARNVTGGTGPPSAEPVHPGAPAFAYATAPPDVRVPGRAGIFAVNSRNGTGLKISSTGTVAGGHNGVVAINAAGGDTELFLNDVAVSLPDRTAAITAESPSIASGPNPVFTPLPAGIAAYSQVATGHMTVSSGGQILSEAHGILAQHLGSGRLEIIANEVGAGFADPGVPVVQPSETDPTAVGIWGHTGPNAAGQSIITSGTVKASGWGVVGTNFGTGALSISTIDVAAGVMGDSGAALPFGEVAGSADVQSHAVGVYGFNAATASNLAITSEGVIEATRSGIVALNFGTGDINVTAETVHAYAAPDRVRPAAEAFGASLPTAPGPIGNLTTTSQAVGVGSAATSGNMSIAVSGMAASSGGGIYALHHGSGSLEITAGAVTAGVPAPDALSPPGSADGPVVATGILARNSANGTALRISAHGDTVATGGGIYARNDGSGELRIVSGNVTAGTAFDTQTALAGEAVPIGPNAQRSGIYAVNTGASDLAIFAGGTVTAPQFGIFAENLGGGSVTISAQDVTTGAGLGAMSSGIYGVNSANGTDLRVTAGGTVTGGNGIHAANDGSGPTSITVTGAVAGLERDGIVVTDTGSAAEGAEGAVASISIDVDGTVSGARNGITIEAGAASHATIDIGDGASVTGGSGFAIEEGALATTLTLAGGVSGDVSLGSNGDVVRIVGNADLSAAGTIDGGGDADRLVFDATTQPLTNQFVNFESVALTGGAAVSVDGLATSLGQLSIDRDSRFQVNGTARIAADATALRGTVSLADGDTDDQLDVTGDFGGGVLALDADLAAATPDADLLAVTGTTGVGGVTAITLSDIGGGEINAAGLGRDALLLVDVSGTSNDGDFILAGGAFSAGPFRFDVFRNGGGDFRLGATGLTAGGLFYPDIGRHFTAFWGAGGPPIPTGGADAAVSRHASVFSIADADRLGTRAVDRFWFQVLGAREWSRGELTAGSVTATSETELSFGGFRAGAVFALDDTAAGTWTATTALHFAESSLDAVEMATGVFAGTAGTTSYGGSVALGFEGSNGVFSTAEVGLLLGEIEVTTGSGETGSTHGASVSMALDVGKRFDLGAGLSVRPSAGLSAVHSRINSFTDSADTTVSIADRTLYTARVGIETDQVWSVDNGTVSLRGGVHVHRQVGDGQAVATIAGVPVANAVNGVTSAALNLGLDWTSDNGLRSAWTDIRYRAAVDGTRDRSLSASVGLAIRF